MLYALMICNSQPSHNGKTFPYSPGHLYIHWVQLDKQWEYAITEGTLRLSGKRWALDVSSRIYWR